MYNVSSVKLSHRSPIVLPVGAVLLAVALAPELALAKAALACMYAELAWALAKVSVGELALLAAAKAALACK